MATIVDESGAAGHPQPTPEEVRAQLAHLLADPAMKASARRRDFLRFIVKETLAGRAGQLKGFTVAHAVFDRDESFDQASDPVVRIEARRLRRDLDCYYIDAGRDAPVRIRVPTGSYIPHFERRPDGGASLPPAQSDAEPGAAVPAIPPAVPAGAPRRGRRWLGAAGLTAAAILAVALALSAWHRSHSGPVAQAGIAMAVLPFEAAGAGDETRFLAAGLSQQLVTDLMRFGGLRLYEASPTDAGDPEALATTRGVRYFVSGTAASEASGVRIGARLVEAASGRVLWSQTYDQPPEPEALLAAQADIAAEVATALGQPYGPAQTDFARRAAAGEAATMPSYSCVLQANLYRRAFSAAAWRPELACLERAVARAPDYAEAWAMLGWLRMDGIRFGFAPAGAGFDEVFAATDRALALDPSNVTALKASSSINYYAGHHDDAERLQRQALALNPNDPDTLAQLGWRLASRGNWSEGIRSLRRAISRTIDPPAWYYHLVAVDAYRRGDLEAMLDAAQRSTANGSGASWALLAIAEGAVGNQAAATSALSRMASAAPRLAVDPEAVLRGHQLTDDTVRLLMDGLTEAGWRVPSR